MFFRQYLYREILVFFCAFFLTPAFARIGEGKDIGTAPPTTEPSPGPKKSAQPIKPEIIVPDSALPSSLKPAQIPDVLRSSGTSDYTSSVVAGTTGGIIAGVIEKNGLSGQKQPDSKKENRAAWRLIAILAGAYFILRYASRMFFRTQTEALIHAPIPIPQPNSAISAVDKPKLPLTHIELDTETATELFFKIRVAWTRRNLSPVLDLITPEMQSTLAEDLEQLKKSGELAKLENISLTEVKILEAQAAQNLYKCQVRFKAKVLDYTIDEVTHEVVQGDDSKLVDFEEDWTFIKQPGAKNWQLMEIS